MNATESYSDTFLRYIYVFKNLASGGLRGTDYTTWFHELTYIFHIFHHRIDLLMAKWQHFSKKNPGGFAPLDPHQGHCPWTPLGAAPPDPCWNSLGDASRRLGRTAHGKKNLLASLAGWPLPMRNPGYAPVYQLHEESSVLICIYRGPCGIHLPLSNIDMYRIT